MKRKLVIGDIHGGLLALEQLLDLAHVTSNDQLIFLGDYVDGWSQSAQVVDFLIELSDKQECVFIKGNHDQWCEDWLRSGDKNRDWILHGGKATVDSYKESNPKIKLKHLHFLEIMKPYFIDDNSRLFIHAGFSSMHGPSKEPYASNFSWDRTLWETALAMDKNIPKESLLYPRRLKLFHEIFIGHTPTLNYNQEIPMQASNVWNIDTGAAFTGKLTIMDIETKNFWQSERLQDLYPREKGRNA